MFDYLLALLYFFFTFLSLHSFIFPPLLSLFSSFIFLFSFFFFPSLSLSLPSFMFLLLLLLLLLLLFNPLYLLMVSFFLEHCLTLTHDIFFLNINADVLIKRLGPHFFMYIISSLVLYFIKHPSVIWIHFVTIFSMFWWWFIETEMLNFFTFDFFVFSIFPPHANTHTHTYTHTHTHIYIYIYIERERGSTENIWAENVYLISLFWDKSYAKIYCNPRNKTFI